MKIRMPLLLLGLLVVATPSRAILFASTEDPTFNTTPPTGSLQDSGWQFEGKWDGKIGTPISAECFVTAAHVGGAVGNLFTFGGQTYVTDRVDRYPDVDLALWHVTEPFPIWAPLYRNSDEVGKNAVLFGTGTQRGGEVSANGSPRGWFWGEGDGVQRWGTNTVSAVRDGGANAGPQIVAEFNLGVSDTEAHLSVGDSGGGVFIQDSDKVWKLAGINVDVDGYYATDESGALLDSIWGWPGLAALYDQSGFYLDGYTGVFVPAGGPGRLYATRISSSAAFIDSICPSVLPEPGSIAEALAAFSGLALLARRRLPSPGDTGLQVLRTR